MAEPEQRPLTPEPDNGSTQPPAPEQPSAGLPPEQAEQAAPRPEPAAVPVTPPPSPYETPIPQPAPYEPQAPIPPAPYGQQPTAPYGQQSPAPYGQPPATPYGQPYSPPPAAYPAQPYTAGPGGVPPQPPMPPYPGQPPYPPAPEKPKRKVWPWVLGGCLGALLLLVICFGGCVACTAYLGSEIESAASDYRNDRSRNYDYGYNYDRGDRSSSGAFTLSEIKDLAGTAPSKIEDGRCTPGVYEVGPGKQLSEGVYFLEGSQAEEGSFYVFDANDGGGYDLDDAVIYYGNYLTDLDDGDVIVFLGPDSARMYPLAKADFKPQAPYPSGLYRVGTDLPAGTYTVTAAESVPTDMSDEPAAFVMKDLDFDSDSITQTKYVTAGGSQTVTVNNGDYLELYAATATPAA